MRLAAHAALNPTYLLLHPHMTILSPLPCGKLPSSLVHYILRRGPSNNYRIVKPDRVMERAPLPPTAGRPTRATSPWTGTPAPACASVGRKINYR